MFNRSDITVANIFKNLLNGLNLGDDDFDDEDDGYNWDEPAKKSIARSKRESDDDDAEEELPKRKPFGKKDESFDNDDDYEQKPVKQPKRNYGKVVHMKSIQGGAGRMELRVIRPKMYDDSKEICDTLAGGMPVVLNLEGLNGDLAQKILDFTSGAVYAMDGNLQKVTSYIFVITPSSVDISGNFDEMLDGSVDLSGSTKYVFRD
jgi:cell division inhibitor SepF